MIGRKPNGYLKNWNNFEKELWNAIRENNGEFNVTQFRKLGFSSVVYAIAAYYGGKDKVLARVHYETKKSIKYYKLWNNIESALIIIISKVGSFPNETQLRNMGYRNLAVSFYKYHGGIRNVRKKMGYDSNTKPKHYWEHGSITG